PLIFMDGVAGRLLREFSLTLIFAIVVSTFVSLSITPMICAHYIKPEVQGRRTRLDRIVDGALDRLRDSYGRTLRVVLRFSILTLLVFVSTLALTGYLYVKVPKSYFPADDSGLIIGGTRASPDISFQAMLGLQQRVADIVLKDPAVAALGSSMGSISSRGQ